MAMLNYLDLTLHFKLQLICIQERKRVRCLALINNFLDVFNKKTKVTVKTVQKLMGSFNFIT